MPDPDRPQLSEEERRLRTNLTIFGGSTGAFAEVVALLLAENSLWSSVCDKMGEWMISTDDDGLSPEAFARLLAIGCIDRVVQGGEIVTTVDQHPECAGLYGCPIVWECKETHPMPLGRQEIKDKFLAMSALKPGWNSYGAEPPSVLAINAKAFLSLADWLGCWVTRVALRAIGGVGVTSREGGLSTYVEFWNDGMAIALFSVGESEPESFKCELDPASLATLIEKIQTFFREG